MNSSDQAYYKILKERMDKITEQIKKLQSKKVSLLSFNNLIDIKIKGLEVEYGKLKEQIDTKADRVEISNRGEKALTRLDDKALSNEEKKQEYQNTINELNNLKAGIATKHGKAVIDRKIKRINDKIKNLNNKNVRIEKIQRSLLYPKYLYRQHRQRKIDKAEGRVLFNEARYSDNEILKQTVDPNTKLGALKTSIYDIKGMFYLKRLERSNKLLEKMNNKYSPTKAKGARVVNIKKKLRDKLRSITTPEPTHTPAPAPAM